MRNSTSTRKKSGTKSSKVPALVGLTNDEVRHLPKPHPGFEPYVAALTEAFRTFGDELGSADLVGLESSLDAAAALEPREVAAQKELDLIQKTRLMHRSNAWRMALLLYGRLRQAARTNVAIRRAIEPLEKFLKQKPRKKARVPVTPPVTPTPTMN